MASEDITGKQFGRLTAVEFSGWRVFPCGQRHQVWVWGCECGKKTEATVPNVKKGHTRSCGCLGDENRLQRAQLNTTHGHARKGQQHPLYVVYSSIQQRCNDNGYHRYADWGGRGIKNLWTSYEDFYRDMADSYQPGLQIERKDNNGHYCKGNCRWATAKEQALNRRTNIKLTFKGETLSISQWAERLKIGRCTLEHRFHAGWPVEQILTQKVRGKHR